MEWLRWFWARVPVVLNLLLWVVAALLVAWFLVWSAEVEGTRKRAREVAASRFQRTERGVPLTRSEVRYLLRRAREKEDRVYLREKLSRSCRSPICRRSVIRSVLGVS